MNFFSLGRKEGFPTQYGENRTPVTVDVLESGVITAFVGLALIFFISKICWNGKKTAYAYLRVFCGITISCLLILGNIGQEWEVTSQNATSPYRAGTSAQINMLLGIKIGLRSVNVTLKRVPTADEKLPLPNEVINYNERFYWTWDQGRFGFGPHAGLLQQSFREAQRRGLPLPILWVMEYFIIDGEGFRFGRFYRTAGWYTHILLWVGFATWIVANIFLCVSGLLALKFIALTGVWQILACIVWCSVRNPTELVILYGDEQLTTSYGIHFWMTLFNGIFCLVLSAILCILDINYPDVISVVLGLDPLEDYMQIVSSKGELKRVSKKRKSNYHELTSLTREVDPEDRPVSVLKRRSSFMRRQKSLYKAPNAISSSLPKEDVYVNTLTRETYMEPITEANVISMEEGDAGNRSTYFDIGSTCHEKSHNSGNDNIYSNCSDAPSCSRW